ncbi:MAG: hypothetical protein R3A51_08765 [Nannocystaceae bacterium]
MKLVQRVTLTLQEGAAEKIFEVDLCRVGSGKFIVNFRYGIKGQTLKDGTKTHRSVPEARARSIFARLVDDKKRKGYTAPGRPQPTRSRASAGPSGSGGGGQAYEESLIGRRDAVLRRLGDPHGTYSWKLERAIWRAGELRLREAAPLITPLVGSGDEMRDYVLAWALARCGDASVFTQLATKSGNPVAELRCASCGQRNRVPFSRFPITEYSRASCGSCHADLPAVSSPEELAAGAVGDLFPAAKKSDKVRRMAREALRAWGGKLREGVVADARRGLPDALRLAHEEGSESLTRALLGALSSGDGELLVRLYEIDDEPARAALLAALRTLPLKPSAFRGMRHVFKAAEVRGDGEVFGLLAYRFARQNAMFSGKRSVLVSGRWVRTMVELRQPNSSIAYSSQTRAFLRKRVWWTLSRLGELGDASGYVRMAVGVLLPFSDEDGGSPGSSRRWDYRVRASVTEHWDTFSSYHAFNHILYANSHRYERPRDLKTWRCTGGFTPGDAAPGVREEAFPQLWDQVPVGLLHLVAESKCERVHQFAVQALRANVAYCDQLPTDVVIMMLRRPYPVTVRFAHELAVKRFDPVSPDLALVEAMADCALEEARADAHRWIDQDRRRYLGSHGFVASLITSVHADTRAFARRLLASASMISSDAAAVIARVIAALVAMPRHGKSKAAGDQLAHETRVREACQTLQASFARELRSIGLEIVADLLSHPLRPLQEFAGELLLAHDVRPRDLPEDLLAAVMNARYDSVRGVGVRLFGELPDHTLMGRKALVVALVTSPLADVREAIRPVIQRLVGAYREFAGELASLLLVELLRTERVEGLHSYLLRLLKSELLPSLSHIGKDVVLRLLRASGSHAQELGGILLARNVDPDELTVSEVAKLASHEILAVREAAWAYFRDNPRRIRADMDAAIKILDATWDDSRAFAFTYFREQFNADDLTPQVLVGVCDSVREDVQAFGRELITKFFDEADGPEYLLKLSEHPSAELQLFASSYLEDHAAGDTARLRSLQPYFLSVLSRVNKGRVAKARVYDFLVEEAQKSPASAELVAAVLIRQSVTAALGDRASCIQAMLLLRERYPDLALPITIVAPPARGVQEGASAV